MDHLDTGNIGHIKHRTKQKKSKNSTHRPKNTDPPRKMVVNQCPHEG